jgi:hypothetical protein
MFTNDNSRTRHAAAAAIFAAAIVALPTQGFSAPKRDVSHGKWNQVDILEGHYGHPSNPPAGTGDNTIRFGEMKKKDQTFAKEPKTGTEGRYGHPSNPPAGTGDTNVRFGEMNKRDTTISPEPDIRNLGQFGHPSNPTDGTGDNTIRFGEMKKKDSFAKEPRTGTEGRYGHPSNPPAGTGDNTIRFGEMNKRDTTLSPEPSLRSLGQFGHPSNPPAGTGDNTIRFGAMQTDSSATQTGSSAARTSSPDFIRSLDLSSGGHWVGGASSYVPARNPFADGRVWASLTRDGGNNLVATAGMSFLLK